MKKAISIILCAVMILSLSAAAFAAEPSLPVIFVPGYTSSRMYINRGTASEKRVWKIDVADEITDALKKEIPAVLRDSGKAVLGNYEPLFKTLEPYADEITEYLRINNDGTSAYDVEVYPHSVETTRLDKLKAIGYYPDHDTLVLLNKYTDSRNIYCCTLDWRLGQIDNAKVLSEYVDGVLAATGAEKVNIIGVSYGGQVTASYLSLYGGDKVEKAVLHCPALDGSSIVPQLLGYEDIDIAWSDLLKLVQTFRGEETDFSQITDVFSPDFINGFVKEFIHYYMCDLFMNFGSAWDLVPLAQYEELRDRLINDGAHDAITEKSDAYHYRVAAKLRENFEKLKNEGVEISVIAGYGYRLAADNGMTSDAVIETASSTGASCPASAESAELSGTPLHCYVSPDALVDASEAYLPDNTWFVRDMFHGLGTNEKNVSELIGELLFTDNIKSVRSSVKYPQFMTSANSFNGVLVGFSSCAQGFMTPFSTGMTVTNLSREKSIYLSKITACGAGLKFGYSVDRLIAPGESISVSVSGKLPADLSVFRVSTEYTQLSENYRGTKNRTQYFRFTDGSLYNEVLSAETDGSSVRIPGNGDGRQGRYGIENLPARFAFFLKKILFRVSAFFNGTSGR